MNRRHTLTINHEEFLRLKNKGIFGESYSDLIARLIEDNERLINTTGKKE